MADDIIHIDRYLGRPLKEGSQAFSVWGGEGERARFALPLWRAIYLLGAIRGGIVWIPGGQDPEPTTFFTLDLGKDPARTSFPMAPLDLLQGQDAPAVASTREGDVAVLLGGDGGKRWYLLVVGGDQGAPVQGKKREDLLFLAGECAGLLFFREFSRGAP